MFRCCTHQENQKGFFGEVSLEHLNPMQVGTKKLHVIDEESDPFMSQATQLGSGGIRQLNFRVDPITNYSMVFQ